MNFEALETHDPFARLRNGLRKAAQLNREWAGIPLPIEDQPLIIEPTYPHAKELMGLHVPTVEPAPEHIRSRSSFWSSHRRSEILIWTDRGKIHWGVIPGVHHITQDLATVGASVAWGIEQEARAIQLLATLVRHHQFKQYMLTGMFLESSPRSHVSYVFRRLRPTVAVSHRNDRLKILCCMCLHPIGYYAGSWAGAMAPTDDVIAHLMLMRGDEHMFWRRANQHPAYRPEAGL